MLETQPKGKVVKPQWQGTEVEGEMGTLGRDAWPSWPWGGAWMRGGECHTTTWDTELAHAHGILYEFGRGDLLLWAQRASSFRLRAPRAGRRAPSVDISILLQKSSKHFKIRDLSRERGEGGYVWDHLEDSEANYEERNDGCKASLGKGQMGGQTPCLPHYQSVPICFMDCASHA